MSKSAFYAAKESIRKHRDFLFQENDEVQKAAQTLLAEIEEDIALGGHVSIYILEAAEDLRSVMEKWKKKTSRLSSNIFSVSNEPE